MPCACQAGKGKKTIKNPRQPPNTRPKANFNRPKKGKMNFG